MRRQLKRSVSLLFATYTLSHLILHMHIMAVEVFFLKCFLFSCPTLCVDISFCYSSFFCLKSVFIFHKLLILLFLFSWILLYSLTTTTHLQRFLLRLYVKHALSCHVFLFNTLSFVFISFYYKTNSDS